MILNWTVSVHFSNILPHLKIVKNQRFPNVQIKCFFFQQVWIVGCLGSCRTWLVKMVVYNFSVACFFTPCYLHICHYPQCKKEDTTSTFCWFLKRSYPIRQKWSSLYVPRQLLNGQPRTIENLKNQLASLPCVQNPNIPIQLFADVSTGKWNNKSKGA